MILFALIFCKLYSPGFIFHPKAKAGSLKSKYKKSCFLKFDFRGVYAKFSKLFIPLVTHKCGFRPKFKNLLSHNCLACQMLSKMVCQGMVASMTTEEINSRENDCIQAKSYRGNGHWFYPPNSYQGSTKQSKLVHSFKRNQQH